MNETNAARGLTVTALAVVGTYFRQLGFPFILFIVVMALDYVSGIARAWYQRKLSSKAGVKGAVKKLCYMLAVAVAVVVDFVIQLAAEQTSLDLTGCFFCASLVLIWFILNESLSILENIASIGVPVPAFLLKLIKRLKESAESKEDDDGDK